MKYKVIDKNTKKDITNQYSWVIRPDGQLYSLEYSDLITIPGAVYELIEDGDEDTQDNCENHKHSCEDADNCIDDEYPCDNCAMQDTCDGWDARFCCVLCRYNNDDPDCSNCDPMDI